MLQCCKNGMPGGAQATRRSHRPARPQAALWCLQGPRPRAQARLQGPPAERAHERALQVLVECGSRALRSAQKACSSPGHCCQADGAHDWAMRVAFIASSVGGSRNSKHASWYPYAPQRLAGLATEYLKGTPVRSARSLSGDFLHMQLCCAAAVSSYIVASSVFEGRSAGFICMLAAILRA